MPQRATIAEVIAAHDDEILAIAGVSMIYEALGENGTPCIKIGVKESTPEVLAVLPKELGGWPVVVEVTGEIRPMHDGS